MEASRRVADGYACWVVGYGMLGRVLAAQLRCCGVRVLTIDLAPGADIAGDAAEAGVVQAAAERLRPDVIFCCQSTRGGDVAAYRRTYAEVVQQLYALLPQVFVVMCSSGSVYGQVCGKVTEDTAPESPGERAAVLLETEALVLKFGGCVARLASLYGAGRCEVLRRLVVGEAMLPGSGERMLNYVYADDAAAALVILGKTRASGVYNVCGESCRKDDIYRSLSAICHCAIPEHSAEGSVRGVSNRELDCARIRALGWEPQMNLNRYARQTIFS